MLLGVFSLADTTVAEVMTPRIDIVAVDSSSEREEVIHILQNAEHARLLVYDGHPDAVAGVISRQDILASDGDGGPWHALIRPPRSCPREDADRQLRDFQRVQATPWWSTSWRHRRPGRWRTSGADRGEIQDEYDTDEVTPIQVLGQDHLRVDGGVALSELEGVLSHNFDREDVSTVGGLVLAEFGRVPRAGESIDVPGYRLTVEHVIRRRVRRVAVHRLVEATPVGGSERGDT
jgi:CBS domain containing-hemolysin-like protein